MKTRLTLPVPVLLALLLSTLILQPSTVLAQGTAFTYQGRLDDNGSPANGNYDLTFSVWNAATGPTQAGDTLTNANTAVSNGLFTVPLDFSTGIFDGPNRWLEIGARTNGGGSFTTLSPRQQLTAAPYAVTAGSVTGVIPAGGLQGTYSGTLTLDNAANSFAGNGAGLTSLNADTVSSGTLNDARLSPNVPLKNAANTFSNGQQTIQSGNPATTPLVIRGTASQTANLQEWQSAGGAVLVSVSPPSATPGSQAMIIQSGNSAQIPLVVRAAALQTANIQEWRSSIGTILVGINSVGALFGNGGGLQNLNASSLFGTISNNVLGNAWRTTGNAGTTPGTHFLGTTDNQPLEFKVNGVRTLRLEDNGDGSDSGTTPDGAPNVIGGSLGNSVATGVVGATISGGGATNFSGLLGTNRVEADYSTVAGGFQQLIQTASRFATISGGGGNTIQTNAHESTIAGGGGHTVQFNADSATISGGRLHTVQVNADFATIAGGILNRIGTNSSFSVIGGGETNSIAANSPHASIAGGESNDIGTNSIYSVIGGGFDNNIGADSQNATIAGGFTNNIGTNSDYSAIGGGYDNNIAGNSEYAMIPGGRSNIATNYAFAAGRRAKANHQGAFVWADSANADFATTTNNQFLIRATGGVGIGTNNPQSALHVVGTVTATAFNPPSDRTMKENFAPVSPREVLDKVAGLAISRWNFKGDAATPHVGPMAQDFYAAFGLGTDNKHIATVDADGVALAAIQGLNQKVEAGSQRSEDRSRKLEERLQQKETEITELKQRLEALEQIIRHQKSN